MQYAPTRNRSAIALQEDPTLTLAKGRGPEVLGNSWARFSGQNSRTKPGQETEEKNSWKLPRLKCKLSGMMGDCELKTITMKAEQIIRAIEAEQLKTDLPQIYVGDSVRVGVRIREAGKERTQPYEGVVIAMRNGGINETITVRRVFQGIGVERVFLLHSPRIESIKILRRGKARRAKLYYLRDRVGKATRIKQRFDRPI
jgi:large subunit ribosomal protein L19